MKAAIFDLDGTLLDSMSVWRGIGAGFLRDCGVVPPENLREKMKTLGFQETAAFLIREFDLKKSPQEVMADIYGRVSAKYRDHVPVKPYALTYLQSLKDRHIKQAVLTASPKELVYPAFDRLQLWPYFDLVLTCDEFALGKENPQVYLQTAARMGASPADTYVFEDSLHAAKAAKAAGFTVIGMFDEAAREDSAAMQSICDRYLLSFDALLGGKNL